MTTYEQFTLLLQAIVALGAFVSFYLVFRQLKIMGLQNELTKNASEAQSIISLVNFLQADEARDARMAVRSSLSKTHHSAWDESQIRHASTVCANYDVVAALLKTELVNNKHVILENWGVSIKHCHQVLAPFIESKRKEHGGDLSYWKNFEWLRNQCD
jgi:hypothetical protein